MGFAVRYRIDRLAARGPHLRHVGRLVGSTESRCILPLDSIQDAADRLLPLVYAHPKWWRDGVLRWAASPQHYFDSHGVDRGQLPIPFLEGVKIKETTRIALLAAIYDTYIAGGEQIDPWAEFYMPAGGEHDYRGQGSWWGLRTAVSVLEKYWAGHRAIVERFIMEIEQQLACPGQVSAGAVVDVPLDDDTIADAKHKQDYLDHLSAINTTVRSWRLLAGDKAKSLGENKHGSANTAKLFPGGVPENADIVDLVARIDAARSSGKSWNSIAREFTGGNRAKADSLLSQIRRLRREGRISL